MNIKRLVLIPVVLLAVLISVGCASNPFKSATENAMSDADAADKAKAEIDKLGDRYAQKTKAELQAQIDALKAQIKSSGSRVICVPACVQNPIKPAPIVVQPVVVQPVVVTQPAPAQQSTQTTEVCDPCEGRKVVVTTPCTYWRDCKPPQE